MKQFLNVKALFSSLLFLSLSYSCDNKKFKEFDLHQETIKKGMTFLEVSKIIGNPRFMYNNEDVIVAKYDYGNPDGYAFSIGFSKDSLVVWKKYDN